ncbi:hypothetical protein BDR03DRAFT_1005360 [Suillus americanus]|nr:hypothetical protein BDR03DRAFT_1005360 [Suillus americanus]
MTFVSNDPIFWPQITFNRVGSYFIVASSVAVVYDWVLNFEQEVELFWRRRWSPVTFLYLSLRYTGLLFAVDNALGIKSHDSLIVRYRVIDFQATGNLAFTTETGRNIYLVQWWILFVADIILGAIMITRLYAMYQLSRKILIFLVGIFLAVTIACSVMDGIGTHPFTGEELVLSGTYLCIIMEAQPQLVHWTRVIGTIWEALVLGLSVRIAIKYFRELKQLRVSTGSTIGDCFTMLIKSQVLYFIAFLAVSCFDLGYFSQKLSTSNSVGAQVYYGVLLFVFPVQMFVLGPHLILGIRGYRAELVDNSEAETGFTTIYFQERIHVSTVDGSGV